MLQADGEDTAQEYGAGNLDEREVAEVSEVEDVGEDGGEGEEEGEAVD